MIDSVCTRSRQVQYSNPVRVRVQVEDIDAKLEGLIDLYREDRERTALLLNTLLARIRPAAAATEGTFLIDMSPAMSPTHHLPPPIARADLSTGAPPPPSAERRSNSGVGAVAVGKLEPPLSARSVRSASQHAGPTHVEPPPLKPLKSILVNSSSNIPILNLTNTSNWTLSSTPVSTPPITPPTAQIPEIDPDAERLEDEQAAAEAAASSRALEERDSLTVGTSTGGAGAGPGAGAGAGPLHDAVARRPSTFSATSGPQQLTPDDTQKRPIARNLSDLGPGTRRKHVTIGRSRLIEHPVLASESPSTPERQPPSLPPPPSASGDSQNSTGPI